MRNDHYIPLDDEYNLDDPNDEWNDCEEFIAHQRREFYKNWFEYVFDDELLEDDSEESEYLEGYSYPIPKWERVNYSTNSVTEDDLIQYANDLADLWGDSYS